MPEEAQIASSEKTYRRRRTVALAIAAIVIVALVVFAVLWGRAFTRRMEAAKKLDRATLLVQDADDLVVEIDRVVRARVTTELASQARGAEERVGNAESLLADAIELIDEAAPSLNDDEREQAALLKDTAEARLAMLASAPTLLRLNAEASSALPFAQEAWSATLAADRLSDKAVAAYNKLTKAGVTESKKLNKRAATELATARDRFDAAERAFSQAPFEQYLAYVDARIALNKLSQQSDAAWLKGDISRANSLTDDYNERDRKAVALAKQLPTAPDAAIAEAFASASEQQTLAYEDAFTEALKADGRLREY